MLSTGKGRGLSSKRSRRRESPRVKLGISACLLGRKVRYDGAGKLDRYLRDTVGRHVRWVAVCPEAECGFGIPRETMRLVGDPSDPSLVTTHTGTDRTATMLRWIKHKLAALSRENLSGFVFKARSPSCAVSDCGIFDIHGKQTACGPGIFAREFMRRFPGLPVADEASIRSTVAAPGGLRNLSILRRTNARRRRTRAKECHGT